MQSSILGRKSVSGQSTPNASIISVAILDSRIAFAEEMITLISFFFEHIAPSLHERVAEFLLSGQELCGRTLPESIYLHLNRALICGANLPPGEDKRLFLDTGLMHLMVVSGSHLVFLEQLLRFLPARVLLPVLGVYCFLTGFQPPVMRSFVRRGLAPHASARGMTGIQTELLTAVAVLAFFPEWIFSRSFLMSWVCGLALILPPLFPKGAVFDASVKIYLLLLPFSLASPLTVLWNALFAPAVGLILFPVNLVAAILPWASSLGDGVWRIFLTLLSLGPQAAPGLLFIPTVWLASLPLGLHGFFLREEVKWRRDSAFS